MGLSESVRRIGVEPLVESRRLVTLSRLEAWIASTEQGVGDIAVDPVLGQVLRIGFARVARIGAQLDSPQSVLCAFHALERLARLFEHRHQQGLLLAFSKGLRLHDHLVPCIGDRDAVVALDHTLVRLHLRRLIVGDVALLRLA